MCSPLCIIIIRQKLSKATLKFLVLNIFMVAMFTYCYFDMELIIGINILELVCVIGVLLELEFK